jgi:hypothetical protein
LVFIDKNDSSDTEIDIDCNDKVLENSTEGSFSKIATLKKTKFLFSFFQPTMQVSKKLLPVPVFSNKATNNASQQCQILHHSIVM